MHYKSVSNHLQSEWKFDPVATMFVYCSLAYESIDVFTLLQMIIWTRSVYVSLTYTRILLCVCESSSHFFGLLWNVKTHIYYILGGVGLNSCFQKPTCGKGAFFTNTILRLFNSQVWHLYQMTMLVKFGNFSKKKNNVSQPL